MDADRVAAIPLFADLEPREREAVAAVASDVVAQEGQRLATEGDFGHAVFAIEEGTAEVRIDNELVRTLGRGDVFGEIAVIASGRRTASVVATSPMRLIALFKRDVWALEDSAPDAAARLRDLIATHRTTSDPR